MNAQRCCVTAIIYLWGVDSSLLERTAAGIMCAQVAVFTPVAAKSAVYTGQTSARGKGHQCKWARRISQSDEWQLYTVVHVGPQPSGSFYLNYVYEDSLSSRSRLKSSVRTWNFLKDHVSPLIQYSRYILWVWWRIKLLQVPPGWALGSTGEGLTVVRSLMGHCDHHQNDSGAFSCISFLCSKPRTAL